LSAGADASTLACLQRHAQAIGLAFQVVDDILDVTADSATLGKTAGKDQANDKPTFVSLLGLVGAQAQAQALLQEALAALDAANLRDDGALRALAHRVVQRDR
jgi:farnesyl diphosphate synthase